MACNSMYQKAHQVQLILLPPMYFDLVITGNGLSPSYFFLNRELLVIGLEPGTHTMQLKNFQRRNKVFLNMT